MFQSMLSWKAGLCLCFLFTSLLLTTNAQTEEGLILKKPFKKSLYNGKRFLKLKDKEKAEILLATGDQQVEDAFKTYKGIKNVGLGIMVAGVAVQGLGLYQQWQSANSGELFSSGPYTTLGGTFILVTGVVLINTAGLSQLRKAAERYDKLKLKAGASLISAPSQSHTPGLTLTFTF